MGPTQAALNLRGSLFMVLAMALFAVEDLLIKQLSVTVSTGQIFWMLGAGGAVSFMVLAQPRGIRLWGPELWHPAVIARTLAEAVGSIGYVTALTLVPLATAASILQAVPLVVTLGAALFLGETVGWRRWTAISVGLVGVLVILRPGMDGFTLASLFAVQGVLGLAARDIATKFAPATATSAQLSVPAFLIMVPVGFALAALSATPAATLDAPETLWIVGIVGLGVVAYLAILTATRNGDVAAVAPFRYSRIVFALVLAYAVLDERPDWMTLLGCTIVVGSGLYTLWRETRARRAMTRAAGLTATRDPDAAGAAAPRASLPGKQGL